MGMGMGRVRMGDSKLVVGNWDYKTLWDGDGDGDG